MSSFEYESDHYGTLIISYKIKDASFTHSFGTQVNFDVGDIKVEKYGDKPGETIDVTDKMSDYQIEFFQDLAYEKYFAP